MSSTQQSRQELILERDPLSEVLRIIDEVAKGRLPYPPRLTKYEFARMVAARAKQLAMGAKPLVDPSEVGSIDPVMIAIEEVRRGLPPFIVIRSLPNGRRRFRARLRELLELGEKFGFKP